MEVSAVVESYEVGVALLGGSRLKERGTTKRSRSSATTSEGAVEVDRRVERRFWKEDFGTNSRGVCEHFQWGQYSAVG